MKQSKPIRTHLSTQKVQNSFQKSAKSRKTSKNLYTLNKQSDDGGQNNHHSNHSFDDQSPNQQHQNQLFLHSKQPKIKSRSVCGSQKNPYSSFSEEESQALNNKSKTKFKLNFNPNSSHSKYDQSPDQSKISYQNNQAQFLESLNKPLQYNQNDKQAFKIHMIIKKLQLQNQLLKNSLAAHQTRQKDMISKYAKQEAQNKRLHYEIIKINKTSSQQKAKQHQSNRIKSQIQSTKRANEQILGFIQSQNLKILSYLKALISKLVSKQIDSQDHSGSQNDSIASYLQKCILTLKQNRKNIFKNFSFAHQGSKQNFSGNIPQDLLEKSKQNACFDLVYERQRIIQLNQQNQKLKNQIKKFKQQFAKLSDSYKKSASQKQTQLKQKQTQIITKENQFKQQKLELCNKYNQAIEQLKSKYKNLELNIRKQEQINQFRTNDLQKLLTQKEKLIKNLKQKLKETNVKLQEFEEERFQLHNSSFRSNQPRLPYQSKKKYIDGYFLNSSLNSNKQKSISQDQSFEIHKSHEHSFYQYHPQIKRQKTNNKDSSLMLMKKNHKNRKNPFHSKNLSEEEEFDLQKIDRKIQQLQIQVLKQFQNCT